VPTNPDVLSPREDEVDVSPWLALPGHKNLGIGRHWHSVTNSLWLLTGIVYVVLLFATGEWRRLIPTSCRILPLAADPHGPATTVTATMSATAQAPWRWPWA
jgi:hypothetical protein